MLTRARRLVTGVVLVVAAAVTTLNPRAARPLHQQVTITRDTFGVPHITGETDEAVAFGLGYAQAEDHPVLLARRVLEARGDAASVFGPSSLDSDLNARRVDNLNEAKQHLRDLTADFRAVLRAFAAGANRYYGQHRAELPKWMPAVTEVDLLAASRGDAIEKAFAPWIEQALRKKYVPGDRPQATADRPSVSEAPADTGSNALALTGSRTTSGRPILLGNPHLRWSSRYWEAHLIVPGRLNFYGSTLVGIPWLRAGFNDRLGYVQTNNAPDYQDVFAFQADPARPDAYLFQGRSRVLTRRDVYVAVLQGEGSIKQEHQTYWLSDLGPVVFRTPGRVFILKSAGLDSWHHFEGFYELSHARSLREYERVMRRGLFYMSNFTYADADGHVLYRWMTRLPKRPEAAASYPLDVPGEKRLMWTNVYDVGALPRVLDPPGGSIQNANNAPWFTTTRDRLDPARYPPAVEHGDLSLRAQIALRMIDATPRFSVDDVVRLKYTTRSLLADRIMPALLEAIDADSRVPLTNRDAEVRSKPDTTTGHGARRLDPIAAMGGDEPPSGAARPVSAMGGGARASRSADLRRAREVLAAWDHRMDATSEGAVLFARFWETYRGAAAQPFAQRWEERRPFETPAGLGDPALALGHLEQAVSWCRERYGSEAVAWGEVHRFQFGAIDLPADGASGQLGVYRVMQFDEAHAGRRAAGWSTEPGTVSVVPDPDTRGDMAGGGDGWILLVHFTQPLQAFSVLAYGQASDRASAHATDQIRIFANHQLRPVYFTEAEITAHKERVYRP